jgi:hypothetical protein
MPHQSIWTAFAQCRVWPVEQIRLAHHVNLRSRSITGSRLTCASIMIASGETAFLPSGAVLTTVLDEVEFSRGSQARWAGDKADREAASATIPRSEAHPGGRHCGSA